MSAYVSVPAALPFPPSYEMYALTAFFAGSANLNLSPGDSVSYTHLTLPTKA